MTAPLAARPWLALCAVLLLPTAPALAQSSGVVFVADGSGGLPGPSTELARLVGCGCGCSALRVEIVQWSHGVGRILTDLYAHGHHQTCGQDLAAQVQAQRQACPDGRIVLVGHSSGAAVVLAATEWLPPCSVDRIILLAPAVASTYDVRPALGCSREGVDVFYSHRDLISHSLWLAGTAEGMHFTLAAGCVGFRPVGSCCDTGLYANLRQYPGGYGGHFACTQSAFLRDQVVPLLQACAAPAVTPPATPAPPLSMPTASLGSLIHTANYEPLPVPEGPPPAPGRNGIAPISDSLRIP